MVIEKNLRPLSFTPGKRRDLKDQAQAKTLYGRLLGVEPDMDEPYYVGFSVVGRVGG